MAIAGLLVHTLNASLEAAEAEIQTLPGMTTYGCHQDQYVVVVAEAPSGQLEARVKEIENIDGVLTIYTTYVKCDKVPESIPDRLSNCQFFIVKLFIVPICSMVLVYLPT